ncbi:hypothetical protein F5984_18185 [Rudanella paleaurantiibacter]|uniref:Uncharacterized protein n=1 Tax=Rudanella paleaurantiibacter TaxID=2614655 RepID=A0A7J5TWD4_9BACT|nr:hypothetical protein [Rudanella paleaurantiibacter]KAB7728756.1 hypothetical protein F5984_18185 [Rudanella paleaurantiibacter]
MHAQSYQTELYKNERGVTWQCDLTNTIVIDFEPFRIRLRLPDFNTFRRKVNGIDIRAMLFDLSDAADYQVLEAPKAQSAYRLTLCELIQLRDLLNGTRFALELSSLLHETLGEIVITD